MSGAARKFKLEIQIIVIFMVAVYFSQCEVTLVEAHSIPNQISEHHVGLIWAKQIVCRR